MTFAIVFGPLTMTFAIVYYDFCDCFFWGLWKKKLYMPSVLTQGIIKIILGMCHQKEEQKKCQYHQKKENTGR